MINQNRLLRNILITPAEVAFHAPISHEWEERTIGQSIIPAEERFIRVALGEEMYDEMRIQKNKEITNDNITAINTEFNTEFKVGDKVNSFTFLNESYKELWIEHLWKICAECVAFTAAPEGYVKQTVAGTVLAAPTQTPLSGPSAVAPGLQTVKWSMDKKLEDRIDPLLHSMHLWICKRKNLYPLYNKDCPCDEEPIAYKKKTHIILGIYDDEDDNKCGCR